MNRFRISGCVGPGFRFHSKRQGERGAKRSGAAFLSLVLMGLLTACRHTPTYTGPPNLVVHMLMKKWVIEPNQVVVPQGAKVELIVTTADVEHGLAVPALAINEPVQPGWTTVVRFLAQKPGIYPMRCSIACGRGHDQMTGSIDIVPAAPPAVPPVHK
ncbi:MAG: cupredoxin domain-containing protein [Acidobacteriaceae bacterium]